MQLGAASKTARMVLPAYDSWSPQPTPLVDISSPLRLKAHPFRGHKHDTYNKCWPFSGAHSPNSQCLMHTARACDAPDNSPRHSTPADRKSGPLALLKCCVCLVNPRAKKAVYCDVPRASDVKAAERDAGRRSKHLTQKGSLSLRARA